MKSKVIYQFKDYLIENYGAPLYRISIDLALDCPHRDLNGKGCIFCAEDGARARHLSRDLDLATQVKRGLKYVERRYNANKNYIAYFQSYTNTNASVDTLKKYYEEVLSLTDFKIVIISTRPDCLPDEVLNYLSELNNRYDLWVELGVQSANDKTLDLINRGHNFKTVTEAVNKLSLLKIKTSAHIILGLPEEDISDYRTTVEKIVNLPFSGIKIHNLLVLKKSPLAKIYNNLNINLMNEYEYASVLIDTIRRIPASWPLMRINADAPKESIIAPKWSLSKGQFLDLVTKTMIQNNFKQGDLLESTTDGYYIIKQSENNKNKTSAFLKVKTQDESYTFYHPAFKENFHSVAGAKSEALKKFIEPVRLKEKLKNRQKIKILDIGFGLGYNAITAIKEAIASNGQLEITSLELNNSALTLANQIYPNETLDSVIINDLIQNHYWKNKNTSISLLLGDARQTIQQITDKFDIVFMDGFSPAKNPELWSYDFTRKIVKVLKTNGIIVTYSSAYPLRGALYRCGLIVGETEPFGRKKGGTIASYQKDNVLLNLVEKEKNIISKSTAGTPYRDPYLNWTAKRIFKFRDKVVKRLRHQGIPRWFKY